MVPVHSGKGALREEVHHLLLLLHGVQLQAVAAAEEQEVDDEQREDDEGHAHVGQQKPQLEVGVGERNGWGHVAQSPGVRRACGGGGCAVDSGNGGSLAGFCHRGAGCARVTDCLKGEQSLSCSLCYE